jgi:VanZ family protein
LIVYGSLYPWVFEARQLPASPLYILLHSWDDASHRDRLFLFDIAVNIAIYVPLRMSACLALRLRSRVLEVVALGTVLSASLEMAQLFTSKRVCSSVDLVNNIVGSGLGVVAGFVFTKIVAIPVRGPGVSRPRPWGGGAVVLSGIVSAVSVISGSVAGWPEGEGCGVASRASIWLSSCAGLGMVRGTALVTIVLAGVEALQTRIPSHTAEITDPLLDIASCPRPCGTV